MAISSPVGRAIISSPSAEDGPSLLQMSENRCCSKGIMRLGNIWQHVNPWLSSCQDLPTSAWKAWLHCRIWCRLAGKSENIAIPGIWPGWSKSRAGPRENSYREMRRENPFFNKKKINMVPGMNAALLACRFAFAAGSGVLAPLITWYPAKSYARVAPGGHSFV